MKPIDTPVFMYPGHRDNVFTVAWSPDGNSIASGSRDETVQIWNAFTGSDIMNYRDHSSPIYATTWSPNGAYIASGGEDRTIYVWEATTGKSVCLYKGH